MKKLIYLSILSLLIATNIYPQSGWFWQNPLPQGNDLRSISFLNSNTGFAVGNFGSIIKTTNIGETWSLVDLPSIYNYLYINFTNSYTGYILKSDNGLLKTTNGGINWSLIYAFSNYISGISFYGGNTGIAVTNSGLLKTTNGGYNWTSFFPNPVNEIFHNAFCINDSCFFCVGRRIYQVFPPPGLSYGIVYRTTNNGISWASQNFNNISSLNSIDFINPTVGYLYSTDYNYSSFIAMTSNGGYSWYQIPCNITVSRFGGIKFLNTQTGFISVNLGIDNDSSYITTNGGIKWRSFEKRLTNFDTPDNNCVIAIGLNGKILKSTNFGNDFSQKGYSVTIAQLNSVHCVSDNIYYAVGGINGYNPGVIIKTTNAGKYWFNQQSGVMSYLSKIRFLNESIGGAVSPRYIIHTTNGGNNWITQWCDSTKYIEDIYFLDVNTGFVTGRSGLLLKTSNSGINWVKFNLDSNLWYMRSFFVNQQTGFILGKNLTGVQRPTIYKTTNRGLNWIAYNGQTFGNDLYFINENTGITVGRDGKIYRSTNGGTVWDTCNSPVTDELYSIAFINENTGYTVGPFSLILLKTTNAGISWINENANQSISAWIKSISGYNNNATFVGEYGMIKSTKPGGEIGIKIINDLFPSSFSLSQNYPNPFNPTTSIRYQVESRKLMKLVVYDILGKEVAMLVNKKQSPGIYEVSWDGSEYPSGVYFYTLYADGERIDTKKMVLLK